MYILLKNMYTYNGIANKFILIRIINVLIKLIILEIVITSLCIKVKVNVDIEIIFN